MQISTASVNKQAKILAVRGLFVLFLVTFLMILGAVIHDRRLRNAVKQLIAVTQALARGQLSQRVRLGTGDELDLLGDSVNRMAQALQESQQRILHWQRQLEETVSQRTQQLEASQALLAHREKIAAMA